MTNTTIEAIQSIDLGTSRYVQVEINRIDHSRRYFDAHGNTLMIAELDVERDQWLLVVDKAVYEEVGIAQGIDRQYVSSLRAAEKLALALRNELDAAGY